MGQFSTRNPALNRRPRAGGDPVLGGVSMKISEGQGVLGARLRACELTEP